MRRIAQLVADLLSRHGLEATADATLTGRTRNTYRVPVVARRGGSILLVDLDLDSPSVDDGAVLRLALAAEDCGAQAAYIHSGTTSPSAHAAGGARVTLWPSHAVVAALGQSTWSDALGLPLPPLPVALGLAVAEPTHAPTPKGPPAPTPIPAGEPERVFTDPEPAPVLPAHRGPAPFIDLDDAPTAPAMDLETGAAVAVTTLPTEVADELATAEPLTPAVEESVAAPTPAPLATLPTAFESLAPALTPEPAPAPAAPDAPAEAPLFALPPAFRPEPVAPTALPVPDGSRGLLPARLTLDDAKRAVSDRLFGIEEAELILQPVHLFDYTVEMLRGGSLDSDATRGRLQVNGTDRKVSETDPAAADPPARVFAAPELTVMDKVLRVSPERAEAVAREWATTKHGKTVHMPMSGADDGFDLTERRTVGPTSGQVLLTPLGVWHRPFWRLWGNNGHVDLDAVEGIVLDSEIKTPDPDFLVVE